MINEITKILEYNNAPIAMIESIRNTLVRFEKNRIRFASHCNPDLQKSPNSTTPGVVRGRNRTSLVNNDQIVIQIPKCLKASSIQIQFDQEKIEHPVSSIASMF